MKINPRQLERMAKRMGIQSQEIEATEVIIRTPEKELVIRNPSVSKVNMMGQETFQVMGEVEERPLGPEEPFTQEDIDTVATQAGVSKEVARKALEETEGDLAKAILRLKKKSE